MRAAPLVPHQGRQPYAWTANRLMPSPTFSLAMVLSTLSGGEPRRSQISENWWMSICICRCPSLATMRVSACPWSCRVSVGSQRTVPSREQRRAGQHLGEDATDAPNVHWIDLVSPRA